MTVPDNPSNSDSASCLQEESNIKIVSPIPLPYTARSDAVLRSMISFPLQRSTETDLDVCATGTAETLISAPVPSTVLSGITESFRNILEPASNTSDSIVRIEPAMASTLMALTEPFLMVWCSDSKESVPPPFHGEEREVCLQAEAFTSTFLGTTTSSSRNSWGY